MVASHQIAKSGKQNLHIKCLKDLPCAVRAHRIPRHRSENSDVEWILARRGEERIEGDIWDGTGKF